MEFQELGRSGIKISSIGLGTWQWGSREWGYGRLYTKKDLLNSFQKARDAGINLIDTAEIYGLGTSEKLVAEAIRNCREDVIIATKVSPWNLSHGSVIRAANRSLRRLGVDAIDLYQIHWPNPLVPIRGSMKAMKKLVREGKVRCVGVSNFNLKKMKSAQEALAPLELASNQVKYNLLDRGIKASLLPYAQKERITIIAYSPLAKGLLSGKYTTASKPSSLVQQTSARFSKRNLARLTTLIQCLKDVAQAHKKTPSQAALNWLVAQQNVIAIPGAKTQESVVDNAGATDWRLSEDEVARLVSLASDIKFDRISGLPNLLSIIFTLVTQRGYAHSTSEALRNRMSYSQDA